MLKRILVGAVLVVVIILAFKFCEFKKGDESSLDYNTNLIQQQIVNVGKLVVTEGHFSEVVTYKNQQKYMMDMLSFEKKALIIVNADVSVSYDLHQMKYDIEQSQMNPFTGDDYNKINKSVKVNLAKKIETSSLKTNAQNRLISELSKILILTNTMGWKLQYQGKEITNEKELQQDLKL